MPLVRYFLFTGGILLGLLFAADWYVPKPPIETASTDVDRSIIRIHSSQIWPAAVRFDTNMPMPQVAPAAMAAAELPSGLATAETKPSQQAYAYEPPTTARTSEKLRRPARHAARASHDTRRRLASTQSNWFPTW